MLVVKNPPTNAGRCKRWVCNPWFKRSPGGGHSNPLQYSCLENPLDREPARLQSIGSHRVGHDWSDLAPASYSIVRWAGDGEGVSLKHLHQGGKQGIAPEVLVIRSCPVFLCCTCLHLHFGKGCTNNLPPVSGARFRLVDTEKLEG